MNIYRQIFENHVDPHDGIHFVQRMRAIFNKIGAQRLSTRSLADALFGRDADKVLHRENVAKVMPTINGVPDTSIMKNSAAWTTGLLPAYFGTIDAAIQSEILAGFELAQAKIWPLVPTMTPDPKEAINGGYRWRWSQNLDPTMDMDIGENEEYPTGAKKGIAIHFKPVRKKGMIINITLEAITADSLGYLLGPDGLARAMGRSFMYMKEQAILKVLLGIAFPIVPKGTATESTYFEQIEPASTATAYKIYYASGGNWTNVKASNELASKDNLTAAIKLFREMEDPLSGKLLAEPQYPLDLLVTPDYEFVADAILNTIEHRSATTSGSTTTTRIDRSNAIESKFRAPISSQEMLSLLTDAGVSNPEKVWITGSIADALRIIMAEDEQFIYGSQDPSVGTNFTRDIAMSVKYRSRWNIMVKDPRVLVKSTG